MAVGTDRIRIGAVSYLNTRPLVYGLDRDPIRARIELSYAPPSALAERLSAGELDIALLPVVELARMPDLEVAPGLSISSRGPTRSVLLVSRVPFEEIRAVALDPESRTSNTLTRVLLAEQGVDFEPGSDDLARSLERADAAVRIGDKALFEPLPSGATALDLGAAWTDATGLPFVWAVWACRPGALDVEVYRALHRSRREGVRAIDEIAQRYSWRGRRDPELARAYLLEHIRYRLGAEETRAVERFHRLAHGRGLIPAAVGLRFAFGRHSGCHEAVASQATGNAGRTS